MSVAVLVVTDGRDAYLRECIASLEANVHGDVVERWMFDDTGDSEYRRTLIDRYPHYRLIHGGPRQDFGGAIRHSWDALTRLSTVDHVLHIEQDFTFNRPLDLAPMIATLDANLMLSQLALRRQPWNDVERAAGGIVESRPDCYTDRDGWLEHRLFFTTNPCLYRRSLCARGWPEGGNSEGHFGLELFASDPAIVAGYWGARDTEPWVTHIGHERAGHGY